MTELLQVTNDQPREKKDKRTGGSLDVIQVWRTIQGEGPFAGHRAVFVRLAGCNLDCKFCDTNYTVGRSLVKLPDLMMMVREAAGEGSTDIELGFNPISLVVITGGEPFRQDITTFCRMLLESGFRVQIETNGTMFLYGMPWGHKNLSVVCSPKTGTVHAELRPYITALKYVVQDGEVSEQDGLPTSVLGSAPSPSRPWPGFDGPIYIQPIDITGEDCTPHILATIKSGMKYGYIVGLQLHKYLGVA